ncbi:MAG: thermonuclease family protein [Alphaproteobacteria bacterium]
MIPPFRRLSMLAVLIFLLVPPGARPGAAEDALVTMVGEGDSLTLDDGREVRLAGIEVPRPSRGNLGRGNRAIADQARAAVAAAAKGRTLRLVDGGETPDRHGRFPAHGFVGEVWLQGLLLERGLARVHTTPGATGTARAAEMLAIEETARQAKQGLWELGAFRLHHADDDLEPLAGTFQLVEGVVVQAARAKGRVYLNFGPDRRTDFTIEIPAEVLKILRRRGTDPTTWQGKTIRVRGWLDRHNGPSITLTHPEQIERPGG